MLFVAPPETPSASSRPWWAPPGSEVTAGAGVPGRARRLGPRAGRGAAPRTGKASHLPAARGGRFDPSSALMHAQPFSSWWRTTSVERRSRTALPARSERTRSAVPAKRPPGRFDDSSRRLHASDRSSSSSTTSTGPRRCSRPAGVRRALLERGADRHLVLDAAELLEERPAWSAPRANAVLAVLTPLADDESVTLAEHRAPSATSPPTTSAASSTRRTETPSSSSSCWP